MEQYMIRARIKDEEPIIVARSIVG